MSEIYAKVDVLGMEQEKYDSLIRKSIVSTVWIFSDHGMYPGITQDHPAIEIGRSNITADDQGNYSYHKICRVYSMFDISMASRRRLETAIQNLSKNGMVTISCLNTTMLTVEMFLSIQNNRDDRILMRELTGFSIDDWDYTYFNKFNGADPSHQLPSEVNSNGS